MPKVGDAEDWVQEVYLDLAGSAPGTYYVTPTSAYVRIILVPDNLYWNGSAWQAGAVDLACTISGRYATRAFGIPSGTEGKAIRFEGWHVKGGTSYGFDAREVVIVPSEEGFVLSGAPG